MSGNVKVARHVIAWESMTARQQAEHLVYGHGYDADYYAAQELTNAQVVEAFITETGPTVPDDNYPWPKTGAWLHQCDHADATIAEFPGLDHDHNKA